MDSSESESDSDSDDELLRSFFCPTAEEDSKDCDDSMTFSWRTDESENKYKPYRDVVQLKLKEAYGRFLKDSTKCEIELKNILRDIDNVFEHYKVNFAQMMQINLRTGFKRHIQITEETKWQLLNDNRQWEDFDSTVSLLIEKSYDNYINYTHLNAVKFQLPSRPNDLYEISFKNFKQKNLRHGLTRSVRRISK